MVKGKSVNYSGTAARTLSHPATRLLEPVLRVGTRKSGHPDGKASRMFKPVRSSASVLDYLYLARWRNRGRAGRWKGPLIPLRPKCRQLLSNTTQIPSVDRRIVLVGDDEP